MGWLTSKLQNSRVYMCTKEVKWHLESGSETKRSTVAIFAQMLRAEIVSEVEAMGDILNDPMSFSRNDVSRLYDHVENLRNANKMQMENLSKQSQKLGIPIPQYALDHMSDSIKGIEVWLATLGAGIVTDRRDDVRQIWAYLHLQPGQFARALEHIADVEARTARLTGGSAQVISALDPGELFELCRFCPSVALPARRMD